MSDVREEVLSQAHKALLAGLCAGFHAESPASMGKRGTGKEKA